MSEGAQSSSTTRDRSTALAIVGALQIALGGLCAALVPFAFLPLLPTVRRQVELTQGTSPDVRGVAMGGAFYSALAVFFVWTGIGALLERRWVRPVLLSVSWIWLVGGVAGSAAVAFILPRILKATLERTPGLPPQMGTIIAVVAIGFVTIFYILLPLAFVLFYGSRHVRATLEARDPAPRWTDACPLPVLGLCTGLAIGTLGLLATAWFAVFPVFTVLVTGPSAAFCFLALAGLYAYFARAAYRLKPIGWWGPLVILTATTASVVVYFSTHDIAEYLAAARMQETQVRILIDSGVSLSRLMVINGLVWLPVLAGYLLWVRRYFATPPAPADR